jgi:hypothetical protein
MKTTLPYKLREKSIVYLCANCTAEEKHACHTTGVSIKEHQEAYNMENLPLLYFVFYACL